MLKVLKISYILIILVILFSSGCSRSAPQEDTSAPDFTLKNLNDSTISLSGLKGRPVLLNFWASYCGPCQFEMPFLQQISEDSKWQSRGLVVLAVNIQESEASVREFTTKNRLTFTVLLDTSGEVAMLYNVSGIPVTYIIDKDGIIKSMKLGAFFNKLQIDQELTNALTGD